MGFFSRAKSKEVKKYAILGVNYLDLHYIDGEPAESLKESVYHKMKDKVYTDAELDIISSKLFDIRAGLVVVDYIPIKESGKTWTELSRCVRFIYCDNDEYGISKHIERFKMYTRVEIENISMQLGLDVYGCCTWEAFNKLTLSIPTHNIELVYYRKELAP